MTTLSEYLHVLPPLEIRSATAQGFVAGYGCTFGTMSDTYGDQVEPGAFADAINRFKAEKSAPLMLWAHDPGHVVGKWTDFNEDANGLRLEGLFNLNTTTGRDAYEHVKAGDVNGLSIGFNVPPGGAKRNSDGTRTLSKIDFIEVSIVAFPAVKRARVTNTKSAFSSRAELENILREHLPARAVKKLLSGGWSAVSGDEYEQDDPSIKELLSAVKAGRLDFKKGK
jgi:HK97 family phage prohead protease